MEIVMDAIKTVNLFKVYHQGDSEIIALNNISLSIEYGSFVAITGESGSGKSTLLNVLACMDFPDSGKLFIDGIEISNDDRLLSRIRNETIGMIFQGYHLLPMLTVKENIMMPWSFSGRKVIENDIEDLLNSLFLKERESHLPSELSGGQQQRVAIGRALINRPRILLADEPTGNLDKKTSEEIMLLLIKLWKQYGMTMIIVTHSDIIASQAGRCLYMEDGKIIGDEIKNY